MFIVENKAELLLNNIVKEEQVDLLEKKKN